MLCPKCDKELEADQLHCNACGEQIGEEQDTEDRWMSRPSTIAGLLCFADAFLKGFAVIGLTVLVEVVASDPGRSPTETDDLLTVVVGIAALSVVTACIAFVGGAYALQRKKWGLALAGGIVALVPNVPLGAMSLIMLVKDRKNFE